jgi:hypothetical protein
MVAPPQGGRDEMTFHEISEMSGHASAPHSPQTPRLVFNLSASPPTPNPMRYASSTNAQTPGTTPTPRRAQPRGTESECARFAAKMLVKPMILEEKRAYSVIFFHQEKKMTRLFRYVGTWAPGTNARIIDLRPVGVTSQAQPRPRRVKNQRPTPETAPTPLARQCSVLPVSRNG